MKNVTEAKAAAKSNVLAVINDALVAQGFTVTQIEDTEIAVSHDCGEFGKQFTRIALTSADTKGTKTRAGFTLDGAIAKWQERKATAAENARILAENRAKAKAEREATKTVAKSAKE
jgi:predicted  nucleic acid-binding Zn-ribbon protein